MFSKTRRKLQQYIKVSLHTVQYSTVQVQAGMGEIEKISYPFLGSRPRLVVPNRQKSDSNGIVPGQVVIYLFYFIKKNILLIIVQTLEPFLLLFYNLFTFFLGDRY